MTAMTTPTTVFDFEWGRDIDGNDVSVSDLRGKVLLITNVASA